MLALTIAAGLGEISRFPSARKLIGYAGLASTIKQIGTELVDRPDLQSRIAALRWAAIKTTTNMGRVSELSSLRPQRWRENATTRPWSFPFSWRGLVRAWVG